jgi:hypothetical protein
MAEYILGMKVIHIMADGTEKDSIKGIRIPTVGVTEIVYKTIQQVAEQVIENKNNVA